MPRRAGLVFLNEHYLGSTDVNFYWRQTIVGLLRHAGATIPELSERSLEASSHLDQALTSPWLERAFDLFEEAAIFSKDPVYVTGAYYAMRALEEVGHWEQQAGGHVETSGVPDRESRLVHEGMSRDEISVEVEKGLFDLFDRLRQGATLEEALALFPHLGDEESDEGKEDDE
ncbi:MAG: hypothetical protein Kow00129_05340 [Thermoleophilia bacterium]